MTYDIFSLLPHAPLYIYDWEAILKSPLGRVISSLRGVQQNPKWHGEGDAYTHTHMVCESLCSMPAFRNLTEKKQRVLALAALMHDIGKATCTRSEDGNWTSRGHSVSGACIARYLLWTELGLCGNRDKQILRESVCSLIRYHMLPVYPAQSTLLIASEGILAEDFSVELLCMLSEADVRGRVSQDEDEELEQIQMYGMLAQEEGCFLAPYVFKNDYSQRAFLKGRRMWREQTMFDDTWGNVILLSGLPGTGKDTWIASGTCEYPVISLDDIRESIGVSPTDDQGHVISAAKDKAREYLRAKRSFIWNATNITRLVRDSLVELFENYGAAVNILYLETAWEENKRRNACRKDAVPESVLDNMLRKIMLPHACEAQSVKWLCV